MEGIINVFEPVNSLELMKSRQSTGKLYFQCFILSYLYEPFSDVSELFVVLSFRLLLLPVHGYNQAAEGEWPKSGPSRSREEWKCASGWMQFQGALRFLDDIKI